MLTESFFSRSCPACNRQMRILVRYLGMKVRCRHCRREFQATDPAAESAAMDDPVNFWLNFTEREASHIREHESYRHPR